MAATDRVKKIQIDTTNIAEDARVEGADYIAKLEEQFSDNPLAGLDMEADFEAYANHAGKEPRSEDDAALVNAYREKSHINKYAKQKLYEKYRDNKRLVHYDNVDVEKISLTELERILKDEAGATENELRYDKIEIDRTNQLEMFSNAEKRDWLLHHYLDRRDAAGNPIEPSFEFFYDKEGHEIYPTTTLAELRQEIIRQKLATEDQLDRDINKYVAQRLYAEHEQKLQKKSEPFNSLEACSTAVQNNDVLRGRLEQLAGYYNRAFNQFSGSDPQLNVNDGLGGRANRVVFGVDKEKGSLSMKVSNLQDTGLTFALNMNDASKDVQSLVITSEQQEMTEKQVSELARFFYKSGLVTGKDEQSGQYPIKLPEEIKVSDGGDFHKIFEEAMDKEIKADLENDENSLDGLESAFKLEGLENNEPHISDKAPLEQLAKDRHSGNDHTASGAHEYDSYLQDWQKPLKANMSAMEGAAEKRARGMCFRQERLHWRTHIDGSRTLVAYLNEDNEVGDGKLSKDGVQARKKSFAVTFRDGPPPSAQLYLPPGSKFESGHAKMMLDAFKKAGCRSVLLPGPEVFGGSARGEVIAACGSMMVVPRLKWGDDDKGDAGFDAGDLEKMLKAHSEEKKINPNESLLWKMALVKELDGYIAWQQRQGKDTTALSNALSNLQGEIKLSKFKSTHKDTIHKFIREGCNNQDESERWTKADLACAVRAEQDLLKAIADGVDADGKPFPYDYLNRNGAEQEKLVLDYMKKRMEAHRGEIADLIDEYKNTKHEDEDGSGKPKTLSYDQAADKALKKVKDDFSEYTSEELASKCGAENAKMDFKYPAPGPYKERDQQNFKNPTRRYTAPPRAARGS